MPPPVSPEAGARSTCPARSEAKSGRSRALVAAAETIDVTAFTLRGAAGAAITHGNSRDRFAFRGEIDDGECGPRRSHPLLQQFVDHEDSIEAGDPDTNFITNPDVLRCLRRGSIYLHVPSAACRRRSRTRLVDTDRPQPSIKPHRITHMPILPAPVHRGEVDPAWKS